MTGNRFRLTATLAGIAALGGAGTLAAVLPAPGAAARPVAITETTAAGKPEASPTGPDTRTRRSADVPGAGPFPHTTAPITSGVFDL
ncbi:hypothetical protein [Actinomycetospora chiangmaiensis]|uniref:hypothetical protein n=1 Tax=Actinomycetospora chiangmaiensis TaxID=402650 RepID=UPI00037F389D|nr:hypothetical protein [Actinomycetospora chiangmaiensis]